MGHVSVKSVFRLLSYSFFFCVVALANSSHSSGLPLRNQIITIWINVNSSTLIQVPKQQPRHAYDYTLGRRHLTRNPKNACLD